MPNLRDAVQRIAEDQLRRRKVVWNGMRWETEFDRMVRRVRALEEHLRNLEDRYAYLENRFNYHSNGVNHRKPKPQLPEPG